MGNLLLGCNIGAPLLIMALSSDKVTLSPAGAVPRPDVTEIDETRLRDVKWLRIRTLDNPARRTD